jgi:hypothetical protein
VHPIVGMYQGSLGLGSAAAYAQLLQAAGTKGFSVYLAEQGMTGAKWAAFGQAITNLGIAARPRHVSSGRVPPSRQTTQEETCAHRPCPSKGAS